MAPLSHFAIAALAVAGGAAAPLPTQPSSSVTIERRGFGTFDPFFDMLQWWSEKGPLEDLGDRVSYKPDIDVGLEWEKKLQGAPTENKGGAAEGGNCSGCKETDDSEKSGGS